MTKNDLLERVKDLPDDAPINFALFTINKCGDYAWQLLTPTIDHNDPADVIGLGTAPFWTDSIHEMTLSK